MERTTLGLYKSVEDAYADWAQNWGLAVAYAVTQNLETAEQALAEALVAAVAAKPASVPGGDVDGIALIPEPQEYLVKFAARVVQMSVPRAFRGNSPDEFMKLPTAARAAVMLKVKGKFSRSQMAKALGAEEATVERLLENARLTFTRGQSWLANATFRRQLDDAKLVAPCPNPEDGRLFAKYLENDLPSDDVLRLHKHFVGCTPCRTNLLHFKNTYSDWLFSLPEPEITKATTNHIKKMIQLGRRARTEARAAAATAPSPWPGIKKLFQDRQTQLLIISFALCMLLYKMMT